MLATIARRLLPARRHPAGRVRPARPAARPRVEGLEGRALLTLLPVNFGATVVGTPVAYKGQLFFPANAPARGTELGRSDGTAAGTQMVADINPGLGSSSPANLTVSGGNLFFSAWTPGMGVELWKTDGT